MYLSFYNLSQPPFASTCEERFFYESPMHSEALANMMYTVQQRKGMVLVTGEVGAGKTFLSNMLGARLGPGCQIVMVRNPPQSGKQLLRAMGAQLGMQVRSSIDKLDLLEKVQQQLVRLHTRGRLVAMILDEAQDLGPSTLEELRLVWNWEHQGHRLIQIVVVGQPELRQILLEPHWEPLRQRIVLSYHLAHLAPEQTMHYVRHRLRVAGGEGCLAQFSESALMDVHAATDGVPRLINVLCDNALLVGFARGQTCIDSPIIAEVLRDMTCWSLRVGETPAAPSVVEQGGV
jgi:general secretion pathway protein A